MTRSHALHLATSSASQLTDTHPLSQLRLVDLISICYACSHCCLTTLSALFHSSTHCHPALILPYLSLWFVSLFPSHTHSLTHPQSSWNGSKGRLVLPYNCCSYSSNCRMKPLFGMICGATRRTDPNADRKVTCFRVMMIANTMVADRLTPASHVKHTCSCRSNRSPASGVSGQLDARYEDVTTGVLCVV